MQRQPKQPLPRCRKCHHHTHTHVCAHTYTHTHTHSYTHMHTHTTAGRGRALVPVCMCVWRSPRGCAHAAAPAEVRWGGGGGRWSAAAALLPCAGVCGRWWGAAIHHHVPCACAPNGVRQQGQRPVLSPMAIVVCWAQKIMRSAVDSQSQPPPAHHQLAAACPAQISPPPHPQSA